MTEHDIECINTSIALAQKCIPEDDSDPPKVAAVLSRGGVVIGTAFRGELSPNEGDHAEFTLLDKKLKGHDVSGSTLYTTLEPCTERSPKKTPCVFRVIDAKVARVVIGQLDPDPTVHGRGVLALREANIIVEMYPAEKMAVLESINRDFVRRSKRRAAKMQPTTKPLPIWRVTLSAGVDCASPDAVSDILSALRKLSGDINLSLVQVKERSEPLEPVELDIQTEKTAAFEIQRAASEGELNKDGIVAITRSTSPIETSNTALLYLLFRCCFSIEDKLAFLRNGRDFEPIHTMLVPFALNVLSNHEAGFRKEAAKVLNYITLIQTNYLFALRDHGLITKEELQSTASNLGEESSPEIVLRLHNVLCGFDAGLGTLQMADITTVVRPALAIPQKAESELVSTIELMRHWQQRLAETFKFYASNHHKVVMNLSALLEDYREFLYHLSASGNENLSPDSESLEHIAEAINSFRRAALQSMMSIQSTLAMNEALERADVIALLRLRQLHISSRYSKPTIEDFARQTERLISKYMAE